MRRIVLAASALTVLAACQPADTALTEEQKAEIAAEVNAAFENWAAAVRALDLDGYMVVSPTVKTSPSHLVVVSCVLGQTTPPT